MEASPMERLPTLAYILPQKAYISKPLKPVEQREPIQQDITMQLDSVLRKRRKKMKKHKLRKRRKRERADKRKLSQGR